MHAYVGRKVLVTTDNWFIAPNGRQYRAAFGTVKGVHDDQSVLGIKTNARSTNWYLEIGNLFIAGCQIHYAVATESCELDQVHDDYVEGAKVERFLAPSRIYNADEGCQ